MCFEASLRKCEEERRMQVWRRRARPLAQERPAGPEPRIRTSTGEVEDVGGVGGNILSVSVCRVLISHKV
jgi:hypothetical protein